MFDEKLKSTFFIGHPVYKYIYSADHLVVLSEYTFWVKLSTTNNLDIKLRQKQAQTENFETDLLLKNTIFIRHFLFFFTLNC